MAATSSLRTTTSEATAQLVRRDAQVLSPGDVLVQGWPEIDPTVADTLVTAMRGVATVTNPKADGQTITGRFAVSKVESFEDERRWVKIHRTLTKIAADDALTTPIQMGREEVMNAFSLAEGTDNSVGYDYLYLDPADRATYIAKAVTPPAGYAEADRRFEVGADMTGTLQVLFRKVTWTAWAAASIAWTDYFDYAGERDGQVRHYAGIAKGDLAAAVAALLSAPAGYALDQLAVSDNRDGSISLAQTIREKTDDAVPAQTDQVTLNKHGLVEGMQYVFRVVFDDFSASDTLTPTNPDDVHYSLKDTATTLKANGRYRRTYFYEYTSWTAWADVATTPTMTTEGAPNGNRETLRNTWFGIGNATAVSTIVTALETPVPDASTHEVMTIEVTDNHNGSLTVRQDLLEIIDGDQENSEEETNPLGLGNVTITTRDYVYDGYKTEGTIPDPGAIGGYISAGHTTILKSDGYYRRVYKYVKGDWEGSELPSPDLMSVQGGGTKDEAGEVRTNVYHGLSVAYAKAQEAALAATSDIVRVQPLADGGATLIRRISTPNSGYASAANYHEHSAGSTEAGTPNKYVRLYPGLTAAQANTLYAALKVEGTSFVVATGSGPSNVTYMTTGVRYIEDQDSAKVTIIQEGTRAMAEDAWQEYYDGQIIYYYRVYSSIEPTQEDFRPAEQVVRVDRKVTVTKTTAYDWVAASTARYSLQMNRNTSWEPRNMWYSSRYGFYIADKETAYTTWDSFIAADPAA
ncbi:MAG: hypothetical protein JRL30_17105 [Deltaproteobacteria bacterium]|nr:hypothetical protein [Deltaproteobacteria bacterium]